MVGAEHILIEHGLIIRDKRQDKVSIIQFDRVREAGFEPADSYESG